MCGKDPTVTHQPARGQRYYRAWPAVLPQGRAVLLLATKRYYRTAVRYYRTDPRYCCNPSDSKDKQTRRSWGRYFRTRGTTAPPMQYYCKANNPTQGEGNFRAYFRKEMEVAKTRHSSTAEGRYYCLTA